MKKPRPGGGVFGIATTKSASYRAQISLVPGWGPFFEAIALNEIAHDFVIMNK